MPFGTRRLSSRLREVKNVFYTTFLLSFVLVATVGCGPSPFHNNATPTHTTRTEKMKNAPESLDPRLLARPASEDGMSMDPLPPLRDPHTGAPDPLQSVKPLEAKPGGSLGSLGFNLKTYFAGDLDDPLRRVEKVERAVILMQRDLKTVMPSVQRLVAIEHDIQALVTQLEILLQKEPSSGTSLSPKAVAAPQSLQHTGAGSPYVPETRHTSPPTARKSSGGQTVQAISGEAQVKRLRIGHHKHKTRIVLDVSGPASYRYDLDNEEDLLIIELPEAGWIGQRSWASGKDPLFASYNVQPMEGGRGSRVVIQLKHDSSVLSETVLKANGNNDYRIVLDLQSQAIH